MKDKNCIACLTLMLCALLFSPHLLTAECTIDSNFIDRGETKVFIICGKNIPRNYSLKGLSEANITIEYEQYLEMCAIGVDNPGIYLILKAEDDAVTASLSILNGETGQPVCEELTITVPDRIHLQQMGSNMGSSTANNTGSNTGSNTEGQYGKQCGK